MPVIEVTNEIKTKPTQHSVKELRSIGIQPDLLLCRGRSDLNKSLKEKIALFTNVSKNAVFSAKDTDSIYNIPLNFKKQKIDDYIISKFDIKSKKINLEPWKKLQSKIQKRRKNIDIVMIGKYTNLVDSYKSLNEAVFHAGVFINKIVKIHYIDSESITKENIKRLSKMNGIIVPGGFGTRGVEGKILAANYARINNIPYFGICLGMQISVIEYARNCIHLLKANSTEFQKNTPNPVIALVSEWEDHKGGKIKADKVNYGGTMRLGAQSCNLNQNSLAFKMYNKKTITERHRHRYEVNKNYIDKFEKSDLVFTGISKKDNLMEIIEIRNHPWYLGCQFHPEFTSSPIKGHPLFNGFIKASIENKS